jgi:hypothetical protein
MRTQTHVSKILWCEGIGFLAIIVLSWVNELSDLPHLISGVQYIPNWRESALETPIVLLVGIPVMIFTKRISISALLPGGLLARLRVVQETRAQWRVDSSGRVFRKQVPNGNFPWDVPGLYGGSDSEKEEEVSRRLTALFNFPVSARRESLERNAACATAVCNLAT